MTRDLERLTKMPSRNTKKWEVSKLHRLRRSSLRSRPKSKITLMVQTGLLKTTLMSVSVTGARATLKTNKSLKKFKIKSLSLRSAHKSVRLPR